ncbi:MAG: hypothetical protein ACOVO9_01295 [Bacteroidia bacterium]
MSIIYNFLVQLNQVYKTLKITKGIKIKEAASNNETASFYMK